METLAKKSISNQNTLLRIDLTDPAYEALARSAGRIGKLLGEPKISEDLAGSLDDFLGAVYALILAKELGFEDRTNHRIDIDAVRTRAGQIAIGEIRRVGKWMAGFHFNSALFRAAAVYHRMLKIVVGKPAEREFVRELRQKATSRYPAWSSRYIHAVHEEVNDLKHTKRGLHDSRKVRYEEAVAGVGELLDLIEAWASSRVP